MAPTIGATDAVDTVILVDVDGVLNVGIRDGEAPLLFSQPNMAYAEAMQGRRAASRADEESVKKLLYVADRDMGKVEEGTYSKFICGQTSHISSVLALRLARIIRSAGDRHMVVLSSNWRRPHHQARVRKLEAEVGEHLGRPFAFDASTKQAEEKRAADRLRCIGDYIKTFCASSDVGDDQQLRFLLLEDFFITPLDGWVCDGHSVRSAEDAEAYLYGRAPRDLDVAVKLVHTYDEWKAVDGLRVQVGAGLGERHVLAAETFLCRESEKQGTASPTRNNLADVVIKDTLPVACQIAAMVMGADTEDGTIVDARWLYKHMASWPWFSMYLRFAV